jgi:hypothetical protein
MYQQLWGYKVEEKLYLGVREQKWLNTTGIAYHQRIPPDNTTIHYCKVTRKQPVNNDGFI